MLKASKSKHTLEFRVRSFTSRGAIEQRNVWYFKLEDTSKPGTFGIGEIAPLPGLSVELRDDFEFLIDKLVSGADEIHDDFHHRLGEFPSLRFAYEMALLDLTNGGNQKLFANDFTKGKKGIPINGLIWMGSFDSMYEQIKQKLKQGFRCIKIKIGSIDFLDEIRLLEYLRKKFSEKDLEIRLDANGAFGPEDAPERLKELSRFQIHSIEQPIRQGQWEAMNSLCKNSPIPIALDEELIGINFPDHKKMLLEIIQPRYIILKPSLIGGFASGEEWISLAKEMGIGWWITSALESNIGLNAIAQWTASLNTTNYQGLGTGNLFTNNIASPLEIKETQLWHKPGSQWNLDSI